MVKIMNKTKGSLKFILGAWVSLGLLFGGGPMRGAGLEATARAYNEFGLRLLAQCRQSLSNTNYFLSPPGLAFALSMAQNGAQGETRLQILQTLLGNANQPALNEVNKDLLDRLSKLDAKTTLEIANALWIDQKAVIKPAFISVNQRDYGAEVAAGNFQDPATVKKINAWVSARTRAKIPSIVQAPLPRNTRLILLDAIYFKADWLALFDTNLTRDLPFTLGGGQAVTLPRMSRTGEYSYIENDRYQEVALPYAGRNMSMVIFLPKGGLDEMLKNFTVAELEFPVERLDLPRKGTVELPRFKLENEYELKRVLASMGMPLAFTGRADFGALSDEPLNIDSVKQKTYVEVNEQGTEAAAATAISFRSLAIRKEPPPFHFVVDRPFFFVIRENGTGLILFLGAISDPRA
jgi:serpin B